MSTPAATVPAGLPAGSTAPAAAKALMVGVVGIALTAAGYFVSGAHAVAMSWLVGVTYWTAMVIGMLMLILIHHILDASWSVLLRRQFEHGLAVDALHGQGKAQELLMLSRQPFNRESAVLKIMLDAYGEI